VEAVKRLESEADYPYLYNDENMSVASTPISLHAFMGRHFREGSSFIPLKFTSTKHLSH
jgi:hypothetical protein